MRLNKIPARAGFTLLEVTIALAVWLILSLGVLFAWRYVANASANIIARQNALENARISMDMMVMNIQLSDVIYLDTHSHGGHDHVLRRLVMPGLDAQGILRNYTFSFDITLPPTAVRHNRLELGGNELASHIALVRVIYIDGQRMDIEIRTDCAEPIVLEGSVCVRYKNVTRGLP
jgi:prepilin-type N-terminal cleavage/methylation domain-containing protein